MSSAPPELSVIASAFHVTVPVIPPVRATELLVSVKTQGLPFPWSLKFTTSVPTSPTMLMLESMSSRLLAALPTAIVSLPLPPLTVTGTAPARTLMLFAPLPAAEEWTPL